MPYRFATEQEDYTDYASGRVFYNAPGAPAFPVRLARELFLRGLAVRRRLGLTAPVVLYDPCCGSAYHLTALGHLHAEQIDAVLASDIDARLLAVAERNLSLLTPAGLARRQAELDELFQRYGKESHAAALASAQRLLERVNDQVRTHPVRTRLFCADATDAAALHLQLGGATPDLVIADVPYGQHSAWQGAHAAETESPLWWMLGALRPQLAATTVVAIAADKAQRIEHAGYRRLERFQLGKRQIALLQPAT
jgi:23S rRNA G2445 N2-methylase RlmL